MNDHKVILRKAAWLICLTLAVAACQTQSAQSERTKLTIAIQPSANPATLAAKSKEIEAFLEQRMPNVDIELRVPTLYAGVVEALKFGHAQAAFMSAWPAALAQKHAGAEVALAEVREVVIGEEKQEKPFYYSYWVAPKDSNYKSLAELKGKRAAFPSPLSTSGYVMPMSRMVELGMLTPGDKEADPKQFFSSVVFAGGYAQAWEAVKQGQADVSVIAGDVPEKLYREVLAASRIIEQQGPLPSHAVVFSKDLEEPLRGQLKTALLALGQPEHRPLMRKFVSGIFTGFQETNTQEHLASLSSALQRTNLSYTEKLK